MAFVYSDMDRLIIERWQDVISLMRAHREAEGRIEEMIEVVGDRLGRWARPQGYEVETVAKDAEFRFARSSWVDKRKGARIDLVVAGFCPKGYRKADSAHPYLSVYIGNLSAFKIKDADRQAFSQAIRESLGAEARAWEAHDVDDTEHPLGRYLTSVGDVDRAQLIASEDALFDFVTEHAPTLFALSDVIDVQLSKVAR